MDANQRSKVNNQTNNGANEKWTPGAKGNTRADAPLDHTYPQGGSQQQGAMPGAGMDTPQSGAGPEAFNSTSAASAGQDLRGGSMQTQQSGGTGAQQGIADSHQRAMEQRSQAYGKLEQPEGERAKDSSAGSDTDAGSEQPDVGALESNDLSGGLPRSPGNSGPWPDQRSTHQTGPDNRADMRRTEGVHESNDAAGGYPRSPGGANRLAADEKMDDDTGFSNPRR